MRARSPVYPRLKVSATCAAGNATVDESPTSADVLEIAWSNILTKAAMGASTAIKWTDHTFSPWLRLTGGLAGLRPREAHRPTGHAVIGTIEKEA
jgi:hypothetical protein